jgi:hypothetical protein
MSKYILTLLICLFSFSISTYPSIKAYTPNFEANVVTSENWVLEYHDGAWWWVLYDTDGSKIMEIPVEF